MLRAPVRLAIFDCDGTLVDSHANICRAMEAAFAGVRVEAPSREAIRGIVGLSLVEAVAALAPDAEADFHSRVAEDYKTAFQRMRADGLLDAEPLYDGLVEALDVLADEGWAFGVATGKSDRGLAHVLAHHGLADRFVTLQTADRHPSKPHPSMIHAAMEQAGTDPHLTVMIGDTSYDMEMARAANVRAIGVTWGYHDEALLRAGGADVIVRRYADLHRAMTGEVAA
ncbi:phosphoglycolate phosphatase [Sphingomonas palmae]|uniref:Phosphoglycolate phosphatase n=1 Tax=Sphingomonas palmae TaxID=1855283 RepID=A0A1H7NUZ1_9SPHN|nr:HAD-IA family hydrolase [Sphingomonas palmae]SEL27480.1 phosphoglycolate phosphatase [Sphingomonas palmae]